MGREILAALVAGETDSAELAQLAHGRLREKLPQLERALVGDFGAHQRVLVAEQLAPIDVLDERIAQVRAEIAERVRPDEEAIALLDTIPGVGRSVAEALVAEIGADLTRFPSPKHLASWAGLCPGNHESAGCPLGDAPRSGHPEGRPLAAGVFSSGGARGSPRQGDVSGSAGPTVGGPSWPGEGRGRRRPLDRDHRLPRVDRGDGLLRPGR
ncbi:MAG: transposase [Chloroflexi bacterium]|nr:transposase [Chloroflexota bacterium]